MPYAAAGTRRTNAETNKLLPEDRAAHDWHRFVLSFPQFKKPGDAHLPGWGFIRGGEQPLGVDAPPAAPTLYERHAWAPPHWPQFRDPVRVWAGASRKRTFGCCSCM